MNIPIVLRNFLIPMIRSKKRDWTVLGLWTKEDTERERETTKWGRNILIPLFQLIWMWEVRMAGFYVLNYFHISKIAHSPEEEGDMEWGDREEWTSFRCIHSSSWSSWKSIILPPSLLQQRKEIFSLKILRTFTKYTRRVSRPLFSSSFSLSSYY